MQIVVSTNFVQGNLTVTGEDPFSLSTISFWPEALTEDTVLALYESITNRTAVNLSLAECVETYSSILIYQYSNVALVTNYSNSSLQGSILGIVEHNPTSSSVYEGVLAKQHGQNIWANQSCSIQKCSSILHTQYLIEYCMAQPTTQICTMEMSTSIMAMVVACTIVKSLCYTYVLWRKDHSPIVTLGDGIAFFLDSTNSHIFKTGPISASIVSKRYRDAKDQCLEQGKIRDLILAPLSALEISTRSGELQSQAYRHSDNEFYHATPLSRSEPASEWLYRYSIGKRDLKRAITQINADFRAEMAAQLVFDNTDLISDVSDVFATRPRWFKAASLRRWIFTYFMSELALSKLVPYQLTSLQMFITLDRRHVHPLPLHLLRQRWPIHLEARLRLRFRLHHQRDESPPTLLPHHHPLRLFHR